MQLTIDRLTAENLGLRLLLCNLQPSASPTQTESMPSTLTAISAASAPQYPSAGFQVSAPAPQLQPTLLAAASRHSAAAFSQTMSFQPTVPTRYFPAAVYPTAPLPQLHFNVSPPPLPQLHKRRKEAYKGHSPPLEDEPARVCQSNTNLEAHAKRRALTARTRKAHPRKSAKLRARDGASTSDNTTEVPASQQTQATPVDPPADKKGRQAKSLTEQYPLNDQQILSTFKLLLEQRRITLPEPRVLEDADKTDHPTLLPFSLADQPSYSVLLQTLKENRALSRGWLHRLELRWKHLNGLGDR